MIDQARKLHRIVIVGGGAAGLELASALGRKFRNNDQVEVTLINAVRTHIWKPLLHQIAAGTSDTADELEYFAQARWCHFRFRLGYVDNLDRVKKEVSTKPTVNDDGEEIIPRRTFQYDTLVIAVGSISHSFSVPGVEENCLFLDVAAEAIKFQKLLLDTYIRAHAQTKKLTESQLSIAIIGAGATGVELAAELHEVTRQLALYGLDDVEPDRDVTLTIIEAANTVLPALPLNLAKATERQLGQLGVRLILGKRVVEVSVEGVKTDDGKLIPAGIKVWAAGIKAPEWLSNIDGLETNGINQLVVKGTLQTTHDDNIFAIGDCAACPWPEHEETVPPRAQAAHQQASLLCKSIVKRLKGESLRDYQYRDYGSLVSLGKYSTVGNLMGNLLGSISIGGFIARLFYLSLYKMHQIALFGYFKTGMLMLSNLFRRSAKAQVKLH